jgi:hypothetical protein
MRQAVPLEIVSALEKLVSDGIEAALQLGFQCCLDLGDFRLVDEVLKLVRILFVIEEQPWPVEIANIGIS